MACAGPHTIRHRPAIWPFESPPAIRQMKVESTSGAEAGAGAGLEELEVAVVWKRAWVVGL